MIRTSPATGNGGRQIDQGQAAVDPKAMIMANISMAGLLAPSG